MAPDRIRLAGLIPHATQVIALSDSTALGVNSTVQEARVLRISIETNNVRYRDDGTDPALTTGIVLWSGQTYAFDGFNGTGDLKFQRTTGSATVTIAAYKHAGD